MQHAKLMADTVDKRYEGALNFLVIIIERGMQTAM